jgi:hypothetical protein
VNVEGKTIYIAVVIPKEVADAPDEKPALKLWTEVKGGEGSGNFNHAGRPGQVGGSGEGGASPLLGGRSSSTGSESGKSETKVINGVKVRFHGGSLSSKSMENVKKAIGSVPKRDMRGLIQINVRNDDKLYEVTRNGKRYRALGTWEAKGSNKGIIEIAALDSKMEYNLTHEIGHNAYHNLITPNNRLEWNIYYLGKGKSEMPTGYAKTSESEGFAESYAHVYNKGKTSTPYGKFIAAWRQGKSAKYAR